MYIGGLPLQLENQRQGLANPSVYYSRRYNTTCFLVPPLIECLIVLPVD